uniref:Cyclic nucleotide-binding domain-containing protein n=1 Tax=Caenorhabditis tropicalis TaxID=1561998 RepID=A0A1I7T1A6_9PELO
MSQKQPSDFSDMYNNPKKSNTKLSREIRKREFSYVDRQKSSKPTQLGEDEWKSPRSEDSFDLLDPSNSSKQLTISPRPLPIPSIRPPEVVIQIDEVDSPILGLIDEPRDHDFLEEEGRLDPSSSLDANSLTATRASSVVEDDVKSQISFVMRERLHSIAKEVHRRTSAIREDLIRETPEDTVSVASNVPRQNEHRPSLMSLIGLQNRPESPTANASKKWFGFSWKGTLHPYGRFYMTWLLLVTFCFLYNAFCIPLRSSYPYQTADNWMWWFLVDYICDAIYIIDILVIKPRLRFTRGGIQVKTFGDTQRHYLMTRTFKLDLLSIFPTDLAYFSFGKMPIWRSNRVLKINSFWLLFDMLDNSFANPYAIRIARTLSYMIYIIHCNSCVYYKLSAMQAFGQIAYLENGKWYLNKWVYNNQGNAYIRCFYFTAAVATSTGNNPAPTNVIEYIYMTCSWMMGVFVFALLLGQIRDIVSNANRNREEFQRKMDLALGECKKLGLKQETTNRVRDWFIYTWQQQKTLDEKKLIEKLPLKLQTDLALSVHYTTLSKVQLFQDCDRALLRDLVLKLRPVIFLPGDMICLKGDVGKEMYIINQGILQVVGGDHNEKVFAELGQGAVFGEISLLAIGGNNRRTASIRAKGYCTLFVLAKEDLNEVIRYYPQAQALLRRKAAAMLKNDKKSDEKTEKTKQQAELEDRCKINPRQVPKLITLIANMEEMNENKGVQELRKAMEEETDKSRRQSIYYPWSTLQRDDDDEEDWNEEDLSDVGEDSDIELLNDKSREEEELDPLEDMDVVEEEPVDENDLGETSGTKKLHAD